MKKLACTLLSFVLCLTSIAALAESAPSKTTDDLTNVKVTAENLPENASFYLRLIAETEEAHMDRLDICKEEIAKLKAAESVEAYFGGETDYRTMIGAEQLNVYEFSPVIAGGYSPAYGNVTADLLFSTPYEVGEKVAVMIGLVTLHTDDTYTVAWSAFEGVGIEADQVEAAGRVRVVLDPDTVMAIQNGIALLAVISD